MFKYSIKLIQPFPYHFNARFAVSFASQESAEFGEIRDPWWVKHSLEKKGDESAMMIKSFLIRRYLLEPEKPQSGVKNDMISFPFQFGAVFSINNPSQKFDLLSLVNLFQGSAAICESDAAWPSYG